MLAIAACSSASLSSSSSIAECGRRGEGFTLLPPWSPAGSSHALGLEPDALPPCSPCSGLGPARPSWAFAAPAPAAATMIWASFVASMPILSCKTQISTRRGSEEAVPVDAQASAQGQQQSEARLMSFVRIFSPVRDGRARARRATHQVVEAARPRAVVRIFALSTSCAPAKKVCAPPFRERS